MTRPDRLVRRPRLTQALARRFEHRVTTVVASAGAGKTAALTLAVDNNELDPIGRDVWLDATATDNDPLHLLAGIAEALGVGMVIEDTDGINRLHDAVWSEAPVDVCIIIDDAHLISAPDAVDVVAALVRGLPRNGHVLLASREPASVPLARLRAHGQLLELTDADLELTDAELNSLCEQRDASDAISTELPRHAATADLQLAAGAGAGVEFLWEEVLAGLDADRLQHLRRVAVVAEIDERAVNGITDGQFDISTLVDGLPLVERRSDGSARMHALLREALVAGLSDGERRKWIEHAADLEVERQRFAEAVRLYHEAGHQVAARETAREYVMAPTVRQTIADLTSIRRIIGELAPDSALMQALEASLRFGGLEQDVVPMFHAMADAARREGDERLEALALHRINQAGYVGLTSLTDEHEQRINELATSSDFARGAAAHFRSERAQLAGDTQASIEALADYHYFGPVSEVVLRAQRWCDLGQPEQVAVGLGPDDLEALPDGAEIFISLAMWLRGEADPALAMAVVTDMVPVVLRRGATHPSVSILGVATTIALAAGDADSARRFANQARELQDLGVGTTTALFGDVALASVAAVADGDDAAARILDPSRAALSFTGWPSRAHLLALPLVYLSLPETRPALDAAPFGPSLRTAVTAGQALVELRVGGSAAVAQRLPWGRPNLLRAHVLPPHLVELACAAAEAGNAEAQLVLDELPDLATNLARVQAGSSAPAQRHATALLGRLPRGAPSDLSAVLLGAPQLQRDGELVTGSGWERRPKTRELCALLLERRRVDRHELLAMLWPGHDDDAKAQGNLRTVLSTLQGLLEPDRPKGQEPFFLRTEGDCLVIDASLRTDAEEFERLMSSAIADDQAGLPAQALVRYETALGLYRGEYVEGVDASWLALSRIRLRALALNGMCRLAELTAARGEPETAARWAQQACTIDPLDERAGRLFAAALDAGGHPGGARDAITDLLARLAVNDLAPDRATVRLLDRLRPSG